MPATRNLRVSQTSKRSPRDRSLRSGEGSTAAPLELAGVVLLLALVGVGAAWLSYNRGWILSFGDAEAHLNIARRIVDSRTPGYDQIGTVWLPLPHLLMLPFVKNDMLWRTGLAGTIPGVACFVLAGTLLYASMRRVWGSSAAAACGTALFALNPNLLFLQASPMTEPVFFACLAGMLYGTVLFSQSQSVTAVLVTAGFSLGASLTRYEGWFLIPFAALYFLVASRANRLHIAAVFALLAALAPLYWLGHNWWLNGNPLEFYNGPYSAQGIYQSYLARGMDRYAGDRDWAKALLYFRSAAQLCAGPVLIWTGVAGILAALLRRTLWPLIFLTLPPIFYVLSMYSSSTPIFVPHLWPAGSYYNTRYGLALLPFLAFLTAGLVAVVPARVQSLAAGVLILAGSVPWLAYPRPDSWICWKESQVNSEARRAWTAQAGAYLRSHVRAGEGVFTAFGDPAGVIREAGDLAGVVRQAGLTFQRTLNDCNGPHFAAAIARPELFLWERWAVAISGDSVASALLQAQKHGVRYRCVKMVAVKGAPVIEIYVRQDASPISVQ